MQSAPWCAGKPRSNWITDGDTDKSESHRRDSLTVPIASRVDDDQSCNGPSVSSVSPSLKRPLVTSARPPQSRSKSRPNFRRCGRSRRALTGARLRSSSSSSRCMRSRCWVSVHIGSGLQAMVFAALQAFRGMLQPLSDALRQSRAARHSVRLHKILLGIGAAVYVTRIPSALRQTNQRSIAVRSIVRGSAISASGYSAM